MRIDVTEREVVPVLYRLEGDGVYAKIGPAFAEVAQDASVDETRPWFEFYRREGEVDIFVPIKR